MIDLRSDTVTRPTPGMRQAMAKAEVGDDGYGEDPSINRLQERAAQITGKDQALFVPSGTMANLVALLSHCRRGDSIILGEKAHSWLYESGGPSAIAGVLPIIVGQGGTFTWKDAYENCLGGNLHFAPTTLVMMENTHNGGGGIVFDQDDVEQIAAGARAWGIKSHIDGARIFNAAIATGKSVSELCAPVDSVSFCLSKGLGCPVGSVVCGSAEFMERAKRYRELLGGGMRQAGVMAAAGLYALDNHVERLAQDHENARLLATSLAEVDGLFIDLEKVNTNMVFVDTGERNAFQYAARLKEKGVLVNPLAPDRLRAVTHLDVGRDEVEEAARIFEQALDGS